ncbi:MAG: hypothetical protein U9Q81_12285 [Pseudomonadota bacterium]|nr:hypothetical protein [Pseudomonadota bacterium]
MRREISNIATGLALTLTVLAGYAHAAESVGIGAALEKALQEAGWLAETQADGSVELRRAPLPAPKGRADTAPDTSKAEPEVLLPDAAAWERLRESGWRVEKTPDGSTRLYPPTREAAVVEATEVSEESDVKSLDDYLRERGWGVKRSGDGSLLLKPQRAKSDSEKRVFAAPCRGDSGASVRDAGIEVPVDRWGEARAIASFWLDSVSDGEFSVGRIRRIFRVYVVSIVDSRPPHRLQHQIAINVGDGRVVVLN